MTASPTAEQHHAEEDHSNGAVKTRGFMRAIGGMFHRRSSRESESRESLQARPSTSAVSRSGSRPQQQNQNNNSSQSTSGSALRAISSEEVHAGRRNNNTTNTTNSSFNKGKSSVVRNPFRKKSSTSSYYDDDSKDSVATAPSDSDDDSPYQYQFLFYPGSAEDNSFKPEKVHSTVVEIDYNAIRPSLTLQMPVFFSPPKEQSSLRRSSILTDPREYEL